MGYHLPAGGGSSSGAATGFLGLNLDKLGIPTEEEFIARYSAAMEKSEIVDYDYFVAFGMFRMAAIVQGVYKRGLDGNASSEEATSYKPVIDFFANAALHQIKHRL